MAYTSLRSDSGDLKVCRLRSVTYEYTLTKFQLDLSLPTRLLNDPIIHPPVGVRLGN